MKITDIKAMQIFDSRGNPTLRVFVYCGRKKFWADVPSGKSTGKHEAKELRDKTKEYNGKGVKKAVKIIENKIAPLLIGLEADNQKEIDLKMIAKDGTSNKSKFGANSILGVSLAISRAGSKLPLYDYISKLAKTETRLPLPFSNVLNGGLHAGSKLAIQEFMIVPQKKKFSENMRIIVEKYHLLKQKIKKKYGLYATNIGDEGGFVPPLKKTKEALDLLVKIGAGDDFKIALDCAASNFYKKGKYLIDGKKLTKEKLLDYYLDLIEEYPLLSIEDPFHEEDFESFAELHKESKILIVGDDLLTTNIKRMRKAILHNSVNSLLLKLNQIGTLTEAIAANTLANNEKWKTIVSHRSGDTEDNYISDLAVGLGAYGIKAGAPCRSERLSKYNRLLEIEKELEEKQNIKNYLGL